MLRRAQFLVLTAVLVALAAACAPPAEEATETAEMEAAEATPEPAPHPDDPFASDFAGPIEQAHGADAWYGQQAVAADTIVSFGGNTIFSGETLFTPDMQHSRLENDAGGVVVWDGETAWVSPPDASFPPSPRFAVLTWPYFFAAPFKLRDPGTRLEDLGNMPLDGTPHPAARLTFEGGIGDTPDDWYVLYRDPETDRLDAMAYIVTFGTPVEAAEAEPHAISYEEYVDVDGVAVPTVWQFWLWNEEEGIHGDPIGRTELSNVRFVTPEPGTFEAPEGAVESMLPPVEGADEPSAEE